MNKSPFGLAPMAGFSDKAMRLLARRYGCGQVVTEMVSAKALTFHNVKSFHLLDLSDEEDPIAVQLFGAEPEIMAKAARLCKERHIKQIDINMGCPVPKVAGHGEGSALLKKPILAQELVAAAASSGLPVSVKMRIGWDERMPDLAAFAQGLEKAGAIGLCVHGRTRQQYYSGTADWDAIREVVQAVQIPVYANGDVDTPEKALAILQETGAVGAMIGRGAVGQPWIFSQALALYEGRPMPIAPTRSERAEIMLEHADLAIADKGEFVAMRELRKVLGAYAKGLPGASRFRHAMGQISSRDDLAQCLNKWANPSIDEDYS